MWKSTMRRMGIPRAPVSARISGARALVGGAGVMTPDSGAAGRIPSRNRGGVSPCPDPILLLRSGRCPRPQCGVPTDSPDRARPRAKEDVMSSMHRRTFLAGAAASAAVAVAAPYVHAQQKRGTLRFLAHADLKI